MGLDVDATAIPELSPAARPFLSAYVFTLGTGFVVVAVGITVWRGFARYAAVIGVSFTLAAALAYAAFTAFTVRPYDSSAPWMVAIAAAAVAVLAVVSDDVPRGLVRAGWWALIPAALLVGAWTGASIAAEVLALAGGAAVGAAVALAAGTPSRAPTEPVLSAALERSGLRVTEVAPHDVDAACVGPVARHPRDGYPGLREDALRRGAERGPAVPGVADGAAAPSRRRAPGGLAAPRGRARGVRGDPRRSGRGAHPPPGDRRADR